MGRERNYKMKYSYILIGDLKGTDIVHADKEENKQ